MAPSYHFTVLGLQFCALPIGSQRGVLACPPAYPACVAQAVMVQVAAALMRSPVGNH